ncbi:MAG: hypothetical protein CL610_29095 [Anaerolineaceae bacterium]|nr:hypothetical protein [Anaerolineaceae bacterium]
MRTTRIQRYTPTGRNHQRAQWGCGCVLAGAFTVLLAFTLLYMFWPTLTGAALQVAGLDRIGDTGSVFANVTVPPTAVVQNASSPQQVTVNLGQYGGGTVNVDQQHVDFVTGSTESGTRIARASFTEAGLIAICVQQSPICQGGNNQYRNVSLDLRPSGAVVYADVNAGGFMWQKVGVVLQLDSSRTYLNVSGIDINGGLYDYAMLPADLVGSVDEIARVTNDILRQLAVEAGGTQYVLTDIIIDDTTLTLILQ